jgi:hypothetical protein
MDCLLHFGDQQRSRLEISANMIGSCSLPTCGFVAFTIPEESFHMLPHMLCHARHGNSITRSFITRMSSPEGKSFSQADSRPRLFAPR